ncbi:MAG: iron-sulfur cluster assembly scaffold protein [Candidatus Methanospirareceae archaeon]
MRTRKRPKTFDEMVDELEADIREEERSFFGEKMVDEAFNPKNVGELERPDGVGAGTNKEGYTLQLYLRIADGRITDSTFVTDARGPTIAFGSAVTELVKGKTVEEAAQIDADTIKAALGGVPDDEEHTPEIALDALKAALEDYRKRM